MLVRYSFEDDSRSKEGQLAREGYVHVIVVEGLHDDCENVLRWCESNIRAGWLSYSGSSRSENERTNTCYRKIYLKDSFEVVHLRLRWG